MGQGWPQGYDELYDATRRKEAPTDVMPVVALTVLLHHVSIQLEGVADMVAENLGSQLSAADEVAQIQQNLAQIATAMAAVHDQVIQLAQLNGQLMQTVTQLGQGVPGVTLETLDALRTQSGDILTAMAQVTGPLAAAVAAGQIPGATPPTSGPTAPAAAPATTSAPPDASAAAAAPTPADATATAPADAGTQPAADGSAPTPSP